MGNIAYICKNRHGTYYARLVIPKHLQPHFKNKKEIRRSLQTDSRQLAIKRARVYRVEFENIIDQLKATPEEMAERARLLDSLKNENVAFERYLEGRTKAILPNGEEKIITGKVTIKTLEESNIPHRENLLNQLRAEAQREEDRAERAEERTKREKREEELHQAQLAAIAAPTTPPPTKTINQKKLSEYLRGYIKYKTAPSTKDGWTSPSTVKGMVTALENFCSDANDISAAAFDWEQAKRYIKLAHNLPKCFRNKCHAKKFEGVTIETILNDSIDTSQFELRMPSTICNDLKIARAFLEWMRSEERVKELQDAVEKFDNAISKIDTKSNRRDFTCEELKTLFEQDNPAAENYVKGFNSKRGIDANLKYWLPLLGLYTGASIAELCQLHLSDIRQHKAFDGSEHWVIDINEDSEKQAIDEDIRLKRGSRSRLMPVHKALLDLGFVDYVQKLKLNGEIELFPLSKRSMGEYGPESFGPESQWWGEYSGKAGVDSPDVVFHSFRTTLTTHLNRNHVDRDIIAAIAGHSIQSTANKYYIKGGYRESNIAPLVDAINKIDYGLMHRPFKQIK
ncbi:MAG: DUF6538 domain-containing protein [Methylobacter sp.]